MTVKSKKSLKIIRCGVNITHDHTFCTERPVGSGDYVFLHFTTPILINSVDGESFEKPGACIFYEPPFRQFYRASEDMFCHDWFHVDGEVVKKLLSRFSLPVNKVFYPADTSFVPVLVARLEREIQENRAFADEAAQLVFTDLCLRLSRGLETESNNVSPKYIALQESFRKLRVEILQQLHRQWTVEMMAEKVFLSKSRFSVLYREFFNVSPLEDLLRMRLEHARWMLTNTSLPVAEVAQTSGFENIYYFSRIFRKRVGCPPSKYYKSL